MMLKALFILSFTICNGWAAPHSDKKNLVAGRFTFVEQDGYLEYLNAYGVPSNYQTIIAGTTPDVAIEELENNGLCVQYLNTYYDVHVDLTLGEPVTANLLGFGEKEYIVTIENGDTLLAKEVEDPSSTLSGKFCEKGLVITFTAHGVSGTRTFKRI